MGYSTENNILQFITGKQTAGDVSVEELIAITEQYPAFGVTKYLLAKKAQEEVPSSFVQYVQSAVLHFHNPYWLHFKLNEGNLVKDSAAAEAVLGIKAVATQTEQENTEVYPHGQMAELPRVLPENDLPPEPGDDFEFEAEVIAEIEGRRPGLEELMIDAANEEESARQQALPSAQVEALNIQAVTTGDIGVNPEQEAINTILTNTENAVPESETGQHVDITPVEHQLITDEPVIDKVDEPLAIEEADTETILAEEMPVDEVYAVVEDTGNDTIVKPVGLISEETVEIEDVHGIEHEEESAVMTGKDEHSSGDALIAVEENVVTNVPNPDDTEGFEDADAENELLIADSQPALGNKISSVLQEQLQEFNKPVTEETPVPIETEPYHTVDYFASQGIKLTRDQLKEDNLGVKVKKFTDWLKQMKRVNPAPVDLGIDAATEHKVQDSAAVSNQPKEILTEAMAEVLAMQGMTEKAIQVYIKLSFLDPSKTAYFAGKIDKLKGL